MMPGSQTPWEELCRMHIGSLQDGAVLEFAVGDQRVWARLPRHNHGLLLVPAQRRFLNGPCLHGHVSRLYVASGFSLRRGKLLRPQQDGASRRGSHRNAGRERHTINLRTHIARSLRQQILAGRYKPRDRLNECQIAREFKASHIPVRGTQSPLQEQGLMMNPQRRGMVVMQLSETEVQQINSLRIVLEAKAMKLGRAHMTPAIRAELAKRMEHWEGPLAEAADFDCRFHQMIWHAAGNHWLARMLHQLTISPFAHKMLQHVSREVWQWLLNYRRELLDVVIGGSANPRLALLTRLRMACSHPERFSSPALAEG